MSINNRPKAGNKGGTFPYNKSVLTGLQQIADNTAKIAGLEDVIPPSTPTTVEDVVPANAGSTTTGVKGFSILFEGTGGTWGGVAVDSGYISSKVAPEGGRLNGQAYTVPTAADPNFPNSPRVLIEYIS